MRKYIRGWAANYRRNGQNALIVVQAPDVVTAVKRIEEWLPAGAVQDARHVQEVCVESWRNRAQYVENFARYDVDAAPLTKPVRKLTE